MFKGCTGLTSLDLTSFNTNKVTTLNDMFGGISHELRVKIVEENCSKIIDTYDYDAYIILEY